MNGKRKGNGRDANRAPPMKRVCGCSDPNCKINQYYAGKLAAKPPGYVKPPCNCCG